MSGTWQGLVAAIAAPNLPAARCKGRAGEWVDITEPEEIEYAITRCRRCPELSGCAEYRSRLKPSQLALGVMAGVYHDGDSRAFGSAQSDATERTA